MRRALLLVLLLVLPLGASAVGAAEDAGERGAPWWERTMLDVDRDGLDDALAPLLSGDDPLVVLVAYAAMPTPGDRAAVEAAGFEVTFAPAHFPLLAARGPPARVPDLARLPGVVLVEKNDDVRPMLKDSVPLVGAPQAWTRYASTGQGVVVAVLDDGAYEQHPDLQEKVVARYDAAVAGNPVGGSPDVITPAGENGHATHVAGTIVGRGGESDGLYKGVAPDAAFVNVKVFSGPNQTTSDLVLRGLDWVLSNKDRLGVRVATMSLGGRPSDGTDALSRGVDIAVDKGLVVVAATGNAGPGPKTVSSPGAAEKAVTVGAVDKQKRLASFSSRGPTLDGRVKPDLVAPGVAIVSTVPPVSSTGVQNVLGGQRTTYYGPLSGSSMATPHVAGVVALMLQANPSLAPIDVKRILLVTAQDVGRPGLDNETGYGFVNGVAAVQVAKNPAMLDQPQFRARLATIPDPPPESLLDRLSYEAQSLQRSVGLVGLAALAGAGLVIVGAAAWLRRR